MTVKQTDYKEIWEIIHKGSMTAIYLGDSHKAITSSFTISRRMMQGTLSYLK